MVYGYKIVDGVIQYLGASDEQERLIKALQMANIDTDGIQFTDVEPVQIDGVYYLSETDPNYQHAKAEQELEQEINQLDTQYREDKEQLLEYYTEFLIRGDVEGQQAIKDELTALDNQYDIDVEALSEEGGM